MLWPWLGLDNHTRLLPAISYRFARLSKCQKFRSDPRISRVAARLNAKPMSVALAWLLQRSPNILLIPGTSSVEHLRENVAGAGLQLPHEAIKELNAIAG